MLSRIKFASATFLAKKILQRKNSEYSTIEVASEMIGNIVSELSEVEIVATPHKTMSLIALILE